MSKSVVIVKKNFFTYNQEDYDFAEIAEMRHLLKSNLKIVILEEDLFAKQFTNKIKRSKLYEFIAYKINNDFPQNGDILYDFEKNKNTISIYYIKGAKRIEKISEKANNIEVQPIQFIVKDVMKKVLKNDNCSCKIIVKFDEYYYYISFVEGLYQLGFVSENKELIINKIIESDEFQEIYVDSNIFDDIPLIGEFKITKINLGELVNENIYEKQKLHSRKIL